jgi:hypothetical protein
MAKKSDSASAANLPCGQCGYENEAERVYCHNCGAKLDRSLLPKEEETGEKTETPGQARKRIAKMTNPKSGGGIREVKTAINVLIYSAILAAIFLLTQKPDGVPEVSRDLPQRFVSGDLMDAIDSVQPRPVNFTEAEINAHLQQLLKSKDGAIAGLEFKRAYVNLMPGVIHIGSEQALFGLPLYSGVLYHLEVKDGKFTATILGGNFGRLAVHPLAMQYLDFFFQKLWTALARERKQMDKMQRVDVQKGTILLVTKGGAQ